MVERIVKWLLNKAGIFGRLVLTERIGKSNDRLLTELREKVDDLTQKLNEPEERQSVIDEAQSQAQILDEWLNGGSD